MSNSTEPMDIEKKSVVPAKKPITQEELKALIHKYFAQLTVGCGRPRCADLYCASNPDFVKMDNTAAAALALSLSSMHGYAFLSPSSTPNESPPVPTPVQTPSPAPKPPTPVIPPADALDLSTLKTLIEEAQRENKYVSLTRKIGSIFGSPESMEISFLTEKTDNAEVFLSLDVPAVREAYKLILELDNEGVRNSLINANERLCSHLKRIAHLTSNPQGTLRMLVILFENPLLFDPDTHKNILGPLLVNTTLLPQSSADQLKGWFGHFSADEFRKRLGLVQQFITLHILLANPISLNNEPFIAAATKVLAIYHSINEEKRLVPYTEFYNELINDKVDLREDFPLWRRGIGFTFCSYPFVLTPLIKSRVLQIDAYIEMRNQRQEAVATMIMTGMSTAPVLPFRIRRDHLIQDSLREISKYSRNPKEYHKELKVQFLGEEGIDQGGVQKEFFQLIVREIFDAKYGMFVHNTQTQTYWFNSVSHDFDEFKLIGTILGLAIYNSVILDVHFPQITYKKLMGVSPNIDDLKDIQPELQQGLKQLLAMDGNVEELLGLTFQVTYDSFGEKLVHDLKPDGGSIPVTNENRQEYVDLYVEYLLVSSVKPQYDAFVEGFRLVCNSPAFELFRWEELELLVCGNPVLDFEQLQSSAVYESGYHEDHPAIKQFWDILHSLTLEEKKKFLFFTTGSDRSPIGGLGNLQMAIGRQPDSDRLPSAHTCFNYLLLPEYATKEKMRERLLAAINNSEGFGLM